MSSDVISNILSLGLNLTEFVLNTLHHEIKVDTSLIYASLFLLHHSARISLGVEYWLLSSNLADLFKTLVIKFKPFFICSIHLSHKISRSKIRYIANHAKYDPFRSRGKDETVQNILRLEKSWKFSIPDTLDNDENLKNCS